MKSRILWLTHTQVRKCVSPVRAYAFIHTFTHYLYFRRPGQVFNFCSLCYAMGSAADVVELILFLPKCYCFSKQIWKLLGKFQENIPQVCKLSVKYEQQMIHTEQEGGVLVLLRFVTPRLYIFCVFERWSHDEERTGIEKRNRWHLRGGEACGHPVQRLVRLACSVFLYVGKQRLTECVVEFEHICSILCVHLLDLSMCWSSHLNGPALLSGYIWKETLSHQQRWQEFMGVWCVFFVCWKE